MTDLKTLKRSLLKDEEVRREYDARAGEFELASQQIAARKAAERAPRGT